MSEKSLRGYPYSLDTLKTHLLTYWRTRICFACLIGGVMGFCQSEIFEIADVRTRVVKDQKFKFRYVHGKKFIV